MASHARIERLDPIRLLAVTFAIDAGADVHAISRYVYGVNQSLSGAYTHATSTRAGGNRWTAYNWENNASNAGSDWFYQNDNYLGGGNTPGGAVTPVIQNAASRNAATILTMPMAGYVSADKLGGGDVRNSGANYLSTRFNQMRPRKGAALSLTPDANDDFVYADEFANWVKVTYPHTQTDPNKPLWFSLDNEPDLWSHTHAEIRPNPVTYAELISRTIDYAGAIKDVMPGTRIFGPASYGWAGYTSLQGAPDAAGRDFLDTYLQQLNTASQQAGRRLLDVLDLHWYPEARGGGVRITESDTSAAVVAARLQAPRSLWDPTYVETSWIAQDGLGNRAINLIPRMRAKIAARYAGTDLAFTEYNYGGGGHISGGIAQADVLGIFGRERVFAANQWPLSGNESFIGGAFRMFRDYDGAGATFGDTSIRATSSDVPGASVYASLDSTDPNVLTIVAINKTGAANPATINVAGLTLAAGNAANVYQLTAASAAPQAAGAVVLPGGNGFTYTMPAYSVTTIRVPLVVAQPAPKVISSSFDHTRSPHTVTFNFDRDVGASLDAADLTVTPVGSSTSVGVTGVTYSAATKTATFTLPAPLADSAYTARLSGTGVSSAGTPMGADATLDFFVLAGDANHDRKVDFDDLLVLAQNYGQAGRTFAQGNVNYSADGLVDFDDLLIVAQRYGSSVMMAAPVAAAATRSPRKRAVDVIG